MPLQYDESKIKHGFIGDKESLTEQEHKDSCDINIMLKKAAKGQQFRTARIGPWGEQYVDDTNETGLSHRIKKQQTEEELEKTFSDNEFTEEEAKMFPDQVKQKYKIKVKKKPNESQAQKNEPNEPQAQKNEPPTTS